jgi:lipid II:glycine glycyltransferase (peptidoglycan interpeptide bridge formation enzyme)
MLNTVLLTGCSNRAEYTDQQRAYVAGLYKDYDAKQMSQCVSVCKICMSGNMTSCTTSCTLKGEH